MRFSRALVLLPVVATGCALHRAVVADSPAPVSLAGSSLGTTYGIQMRADGAATWRDGWLTLALPSGAVRTYQGTAPAWDLMLRVGLATCTGPGTWEVVSESRADRIAPAVGMTRDNSLLDTTLHFVRDTLRFQLGVPPKVDPRRSWIVFDLAWPVESVLAEYDFPSTTLLLPDAAAVAPNPARPEAVCGRNPNAVQMIRAKTPPPLAPPSR